MGTRLEQLSGKSMAAAGIEYSFEDAIRKTGFGKFNIYLITICGLVLGCGFLETSSIGLALPIAQCELNMTNFDKGLVGSIGYVGIILSSHFWGFMADTKGRKKAMIPALLLTFVFSFISAFSKSVWFLVLFRFLNGFCICGPQTISYSFLGEFHSSKVRTKVLMVASIVYGIFCGILTLNGIAFLNQENWSFYISFLNLNLNAWRIFLIMCSVPSIAAAIVMYFLIPESPKFTFAQGNEAEALKILRKIFRTNMGKSILEYEVKKLEKDEEFEESQHRKKCGFFEFMWHHTAPLFQKPHLKNTATACFLQFVICFAANGFYVFFPEITNKVHLYRSDSPVESATICQVLKTFHNETEIEHYQHCVTKIETETYINIIMLTLLYCIGWLFVSVLVDYTGKLLLLVGWLLSNGISSILIIFVTSPMISVYLYLVLLVSGINMAIVNSSTVELYPTSLRAMAVSISMMMGRIGSFVGSNITGLMVKDFCTYMWIIPAVLLFLGACLSFTVPNIGQRFRKL